jgi:hypothetical protein
MMSGTALLRRELGHEGTLTTIEAENIAAPVGERSGHEDQAIMETCGSLRSEISTDGLSERFPTEA